MNIFYCVLTIACVGGLGGLLTCFHQQAFRWPTFEFDKNTRVWIPGSLGNIAVGAFAAALVWGLNSPAGAFDFATIPPWRVSLTVFQLASAALVGFSGGKVLTLLAQQQADQIAKGTLSKSMKNFVEKQGK